MAPKRFEEVLNTILTDTALGRFVDQHYPIPKTFHGSGEIKLIILGQDPTVKSEKGRGRIKTVLNLDKNGSLRRYLEEVCEKLGFKLDQNVYATNYFKNFFIKPPTTIAEVDIFKAFTPYWLPVLQEELAEFPDVSVISLGEPILKPLVMNVGSTLVKNYWGFTSNWKKGAHKPFSFIKPECNTLERMIFPFPHQPSLQKVFYRDRLSAYISFVKKTFGEDQMIP